MAGEVMLALQIQQTALLVVVVCMVAILADGRPAETVPFWKVAVTVVPLVVACVVGVGATLYRIWI